MTQHRNNWQQMKPSFEKAATLGVENEINVWDIRFVEGTCVHFTDALHLVVNEVLCALSFLHC